MQYLQQVILLSVVVLMLVLISATAATTTKAVAIAKPKCLDKCGNISVPYPFGIGSKDCYLDKSFEVACNQSTNPPVLSYPYLGFQILNLTLNHVRIVRLASSISYNKRTGTNPWFAVLYFEDSPFSYSSTQNKFIAVGCDFFAYITSSIFDPFSQKNYSYITGCASFCNKETFQNLNNISSCSGINGCCQISIPKGLNKTIFVGRNSINTDRKFWRNKPFSYGFIVENNYYLGFNRRLISSKIYLEVPVIVDWAIGNKTCGEAQRNNICGFNSFCVNSENGPGYKCRCSQGYRGNPYLPNGCKDIDECKESNGTKCQRPAICKNTPVGDYTCECPHEYRTIGTKSKTHCKHIKRKLPVGVIIPIGVGTGIIFVLLLVLSFWLHRRFQERKQIILKHKYFKKNGGLLMKQKISSHDGGVEKDKIFGIEELEKATDKFNKSRIIGKGGSGTVYKGMLSDGRIVAIKKSTEVNESQVDQFINEVVILTQINHRHIVRLLGCCLETEVPLLVSEYVSSGTLSQHLHSLGYVSSISWKDRLRISSEIAGALAYLHSEVSVPIFHRDIKPSNILLNEGYRAKVSDFGISRSVPIDKTHLTTLVHGTFGYIDPEYFYSRQFTDKSDVYSFGVVLLELLTGERAVSLVRSEEEKSLVMQFLSALKENRLIEILEARVLNEGDKDEVMIVAKIAKRCLKLNGKKRPDMKEVAASLEKLRKLQVDDFLVGETSSRCGTDRIFEVDEYDESNNSSLASPALVSSS